MFYHNTLHFLFAISAFSCAVLLLQLLSFGSFWACSLGRHPHEKDMDIFVPQLHFTSQSCCHVVRKPLFISAKPHPGERKNLKRGKAYFQLSLCPWLCCVQHGTQWASSGCVRCSCAHGKVTCSPRTCPALTCGQGELQDTAQGSCCPRCLGPGGEYCLSSEPPFSPKSGKLLCSYAVLLGIHWRHVL